MINKKVIFSFLLVVLIALSVGSISAEDVTDDVVAADAIDEVIAADPITPANATPEAVQTAVDSANTTGDIVDLSGKSYDFAGTTVNIANSNIVIDGKGTATITGYGNGNGIFYVTGTNVTIQGITFIDNNPNNNFVYGGTVNGYGVNFFNTENGLVKNCTFKDFNSAVNVDTCDGITIEDNYFEGGYATLLANDPTVNKEKGSKVVNIGGAKDIYVKNNVFNGTVLDGVSIAKGSEGGVIIGNTFIGNVYAIYYGGASTKNSIISNNTFENCGVFKEGTIDYRRFPVISIEKASSDIIITQNTFYAVDYNVLIAAEQGNDAHGEPSTLSNVTIANNIVTNKSAVEPDSIILLRIMIRDNNVLKPVLPVTVENNTLPVVIKMQQGKQTRVEAQAVVIYFSLKDLVLEDNTPEPVEPVATAITASDLTLKAGDQGTLEITLKDKDGNLLDGQTVTVQVDGKELASGKTVKGVLSVPVKYASAATKYAYISFVDATGNYVSALKTVKITVNKKATTLSAKKVTLKVKKAKKVSVTLKSEGKALANKKVTIKVKGKTFSAKTNANGVAKIKVKVAKKGSYKAEVSFAGDGAYNAKTVKVTYTVKK
ncbi:right-handed parallel beta-helix repeat-containing protein [Methanobrevibacter sp.]|uniref:right-handed parallel beta-helix repeat-containing protein n=1 Tax=Methanobrevibacter sp. TaxID=66852 RepID=UPI0025EB70A7|nr:NosD domain-containing protein [Methanobrevibacter sp.]MBR4447142.1 hypothetical protein [Methanobrevibacter sp.]